jgi:hypothetical protein
MPDPRQTDKADRFSEIIDSVSRPLKFASKDNFAHIETLKGLEDLVDALCKEGV